MKINRLHLTFAMILATSMVFGQDYAFRVLANRGSNQVKSGTAWLPLKTGATLKSTDEVKLTENGYVGLISVNGKPLEVRKSGSYKVSDLAKQVGGQTSVLARYTDFILSSNAQTKKNRLSATGAVHRDLESDVAINVMLPADVKQSSVFGTSAVVNWEGTEVAGPYVVTIRNFSEQEIMSIETPETNVTLDLSDPKIAELPAVFVTVTAKADENQTSKRFLIRKLAASQRAQVESDYNEIVKDLEEPSALNHYMLANFYVENNLLIDAIAEYEAAVKAAPDVETYKEAYEDFLIANGLK